jgi:hypothetical protein
MNLTAKQIELSCRPCNCDPHITLLPDPMFTLNGLVIWSVWRFSSVDSIPSTKRKTVCGRLLATP